MNVLKPDKKSTIITLLKNGISQREISRKTSIDRKTVRRYANERGLFPANGDLDSKYPTEGEVATGPDCIISQNSPPWPPGNGVSKEEKRAIPLHARSACEPHREWIEDQVRLGRNAVSIYQDLVERFAFTNSLHLNLTENIFKDFSSGLGAKVGVLNFCQELLRQRGQVMNCYEVASWMMENGISDIGDLDVSSQEVKWNVQALKEPEENKAIRVDLRRWLQPGHPELRRRQVSETTCLYLGCGFLPERPKRITQSPLNGRLVFQVRGVSGLKPVILTHVGRALTPQQEKADGKYWSFPFFKRLEIYNQDKLLLDASAKQQVERFGLVLVEGFFDVAALVESGCLNVGALMGSHMTEKQMALIKFIGSRVPIPKITVFPDRDEAGISGAEKAVALLRSNGFSAEAFDWNQTFEQSGADLVKIPVTIRDPGDMSVRQLQWLRTQGRI